MTKRNEDNMDPFECEIEGCFNSAMQDATLSSETEGDETLQLCDECLEFFKEELEYEIVKIERYNSTWTGDSE
jgi:hypothetical protein